MDKDELIQQYSAYEIAQRKAKLESDQLLSDRQYKKKIEWEAGLTLIEQQRRELDARLCERRLAVQRDGADKSDIESSLYQIISQQAANYARDVLRIKLPAKHHKNPVEELFYSRWCEAHPEIVLERQYWIGKYRVDFAHVEKKVVIEVDGRRSHIDAYAFTNDRVRERTLKMAGWDVIRFSAREVFGSVDSVVEGLFAYLCVREV